MTFGHFLAMQLRAPGHGSLGDGLISFYSDLCPFLLYLQDCGPRYEIVRNTYLQMHTHQCVESVKARVSHQRYN